LGGIAINLNHIEQTVVRTSGLTASTEQCGDADNIGFAARLAGHCSNGHFSASVGRLTNSIRYNLRLDKSSIYNPKAQECDARKAS